MDNKSESLSKTAVLRKLALLDKSAENTKDKLQAARERYIKETKEIGKESVDLFSDEEVEAAGVMLTRKVAFMLNSAGRDNKIQPELKCIYGEAASDSLTKKEVPVYLSAIYVPERIRSLQTKPNDTSVAAHVPPAFIIDLGSTPAYQKLDVNQKIAEMTKWRALIDTIGMQDFADYDREQGIISIKITPASIAIIQDNLVHKALRLNHGRESLGDQTLRLALQEAKTAVEHEIWGRLAQGRSV